MLVVVFLDPEGRSPDATLLVVVVVVVVVVFINSLKIPKAFVVSSGAQLKLCIHIRADIAHSATVSDF